MIDPKYICVDEKTAAKLEAIGIAVEIVYAVERTTLELVSDLLSTSSDGVSPKKRKGQTIIPKNPKNRFYRKGTTRTVNISDYLTPGSLTHKAAVQLWKYLHNDMVYSRKELYDFFNRDNIIPPEKYAWVLYAIVDSGLLLGFRDDPRTQAA